MTQDRAKYTKNTSTKEHDKTSIPTTIVIHSPTYAFVPSEVPTT
ncbi:hypothetical protein ACM4ZO_001141 [Campylobacter coli]